MNYFASAIVLLLIVAAVVADVWFMHRNRRRKKSGQCNSQCGCCSMGSSCANTKHHQQSLPKGNSTTTS